VGEGGALARVVAAYWVASSEERMRMGVGERAEEWRKLQVSPERLAAQFLNECETGSNAASSPGANTVTPESEAFAKGTGTGNHAPLSRQSQGSSSRQSLASAGTDPGLPPDLPAVPDWTAGSRPLDSRTVPRQSTTWAGVLKKNLVPGVGPIPFSSVSSSASEADSTRILGGSTTSRAVSYRNWKRHAGGLRSHPISFGVTAQECFERRIASAIPRAAEFQAPALMCGAAFRALLPFLSEQDRLYLEQMARTAQSPMDYLIFLSRIAAEGLQAPGRMQPPVPYGEENTPGINSPGVDLATANAVWNGTSSDTAHWGAALDLNRAHVSPDSAWGANSLAGDKHDGFVQRSSYDEPLAYRRSQQADWGYSSLRQEGRDNTNLHMNNNAAVANTWIPSGGDAGHHFDLPAFGWAAVEQHPGKGLD